MMKLKKLVAVLLAALMLAGILSFGAAAAETRQAVAAVTLRVSSRAGGLTAESLDQIVTVRTQGVQMSAGYVIVEENEKYKTITEPMQVGGTYLLWIDLTAEDGYYFDGKPEINGVQVASVVPTNDKLVSVLVPVVVTGNARSNILSTLLAVLQRLFSVLQQLLGGLAAN